jgi:nucleotide-binding universal stress UspA family protein
MTMYQSIIVGLDEDDRSQDALALGKLIASATGASITVASVVLFDPNWGARDPGLKDVEAAYTSMLQAAADSVGGDYRLVASSSAARGLHTLAEETAADLVVVGSSKDGRLRQVLAGSVGMALLHGGPCSVAIAPVGFADAAPESISEVTLGFDGSDEAQLALREAIHLARSANAPIRVVAVAEPPPIVYGKGSGATQVPRELKDAIREMTEQHLDEAIRQIPDDVERERILAEGHPAEVLAEIATADGGVLVLGSRAYGPLRRVLLGSVSTPLVRSAPCPLIVHPRPAREHAPAPTGETAATAA